MIRRRNTFIVTALSLAGLIGFSMAWTRESWTPTLASALDLKPRIEKADIASAIHEKRAGRELPSELLLDLKGRLYPVSVEYAAHEGLTREMTSLFRRYRPDYGAFVALDASTGRIISMISYAEDDAWSGENLVLRATFPSASVFKVVTAAAAIAERKMNSSSMLSYNGRPHTLYRRNIFKETTNRWTTHITLKDAFARSVNSVFGKLGVFIVGPTELKTYAERFGFNRKLPSDIPVEEGKAPITEDPWEIAEAASGFTRQNTMSPLQGALIAAAIANDGKLMEPYAVASLKNTEGEVVYRSEPKLSDVVIDAEAAKEMRVLMRETVTTGTSRGSFRGFRRGPFGDIEVGGKTGSLSGKDPEGKYDWFVGYGVHGDRRLAIASLVISKEFWKVKSSYLARKAIETFFHEEFGTRRIGQDRAIASKRSALVLSADNGRPKRKSRSKPQSRKRHRSQR